MTVLLKEWMIDHQRVSQMEKAHVLSEVEQLKEQVSPELLFKTLHHSGELTLNEPGKASKMLMKLSQLLRYQLYDCSRAKVLLGSEITFLNNYLTLEQGSQSQFSYEFLSEGEVNRTLVPPLLFNQRTANINPCFSQNPFESGRGHNNIHLSLPASEYSVR